MTVLGCWLELVLTVHVLLSPQITDKSGRKPRHEERNRRQSKGKVLSTTFLMSTVKKSFKCSHVGKDFSDLFLEN